MSDAAAATPPAAEAAPEAETKSARALVLDHLIDSVEAGAQTVVQVLEATKLGRAAVDQALHRLVESGEAERVAKGLYGQARSGAGDGCSG